MQYSSSTIMNPVNLNQNTRRTTWKRSCSKAFDAIAATLFDPSQTIFVCYFILRLPSKLHRPFGCSSDGRYCRSTESAAAKIGNRNSVRVDSHSLYLPNTQMSEYTGTHSLTLSPEPPRPRSSSRPDSSPRPSAPRDASPSAAPSRPPP